MNRTLRNTLIAGGLVVALAAALVSVTPKPVSAEDAVERLVSITGEATVEVKPDMATLSFGVENTATVAQDAQRENSLKMNAVIDALKASGISPDDIQTSAFSLVPVYEPAPAYRLESEKPGATPVLTGYRCNNTVVVKVRSLGTVGTIIDEAVTAGATNIGGITFGLQTPDQYKNDMLAAAVQNARVKAEIIARAAGVAITGIQRMSDGWASVETFAARAAYNNEMMQTAPSIQAGTVTVRASVRIDYTF